MQFVNTVVSMAESAFFTSMGAMPARLLRKELLVSAGDDRLPVYTLTFANPEGKSLGVRMDMGDVIKVCVPSYKPKSYSMSAEREGEFDITLKIYPNGRASGYLDSIQIGEDILVFRKGNKEYNPGKDVCIIAYGVGITESWPTAVAELEKYETTRVILFWALRTSDEIFWTNEMKLIQEKYPDRFDLIRVFSRETVEGALEGRITGNMITEVLREKWWSSNEDEANECETDKFEKVRFLSVGTKEMMRQTDDVIASLGYAIPFNKLLY